MGRGFEHTFLQRRCIGDWHVRRCSASLIIMDVQIKTTMRCQLTWLLSKKTKKKKITQKLVSVGGEVGKLERCCFAGGNREKCVTKESTMMVSVVGHHKARVIAWSSNSASGYKPQRPESRVLDLYTHVCSSIIDNSQTWKQLKCPLMDGWINTTWSIQPVGCDSTLRRRQQILTRPTTQMNLEGIMPCEVGQSPKAKCCMAPLIWRA